MTAEEFVESAEEITLKCLLAENERLRTRNLELWNLMVTAYRWFLDQQRGASLRKEMYKVLYPEKGGAQ